MNQRVEKMSVTKHRLYEDDDRCRGILNCPEPEGNADILISLFFIGGSQIKSEGVSMAFPGHW